MNRRQFLTLSGAAAGWTLLSGHSPYRQWIVYRETHLVIITSRDDPAGDDLGETFAAVLRQALPDSKAAVGRGPRVQRIASLLVSKQAEVGVVSCVNGLAMYRGDGPFAQYGQVPLRVLVQNEQYQLVCREDFLPQHGYLVAEALMENGGKERGLFIPAAGGSGAIPPHAGALAFAQGLPLETQERR